MNNINKLFFMALAVTATIMACEERVLTEYTEYEQAVITDNDGNVAYTELLASATDLAEISCDTPTVNLTGAYRVKLDTIVAPEGSTYAEGKMTIDTPTGVVTYDNTAGDLSAGTYLVSVRVDHLSGKAMYTDALKITVSP